MRTPLLILMLLVLGLTAGCGTHLSSQGKVTQAGEKPQRILSLCAAATDTIVRLGATKQLVAIDEAGRVVPGTEQIPVIGKASALSREAVLLLECDLAFVWWYQDDAARMLESMGIAVELIPPLRGADVPLLAERVGKRIGSLESGKRLAQQCQREQEAVAQERPPARPQVYIELYGPLKTAGRDTYVNDLLELAGATNIAATVRGSVLLSAETLVEANPDFVLLIDGFATPATFVARPGMRHLAAVKNGHVFNISRQRLVEGTEMPRNARFLRQLCHPVADRFQPSNTRKP